MQKLKKTIIIGSRMSLLAKKQTGIVINMLKRIFPEYKFIIKGIITSGDRLKNWTDEQTKGLFVKEIEEALLCKKIDLAVHSMKDLPVEIPKGLEIAAITKRLRANDVLISKRGKKLTHLKRCACIGTSSLRRKMQLLLYRPDFVVKDIRGNLDTRLKKIKQGGYDAIVVAAAGLLRMGWEKLITENIDKRIILPAPAQGALGIEIRKGDLFVKKIVSRLNHSRTNLEVTAEREFLKAMGGGCRVPIGAFAKIKDNFLNLEAIVIKEKNGDYVKKFLRMNKKYPKRIGKKLAILIQDSLKSK